MGSPPGHPQAAARDPLIAASSDPTSTRTVRIVACCSHRAARCGSDPRRSGPDPTFARMLGVSEELEHELGDALRDEPHCGFV